MGALAGSCRARGAAVPAPCRRRARPCRRRARAVSPPCPPVSPPYPLRARLLVAATTRPQSPPARAGEEDPAVQVDVELDGGISAGSAVHGATERGERLAVPAGAARVADVMIGAVLRLAHPPAGRLG